MVGTMLPIGYGERGRGKKVRPLAAFALGSVTAASGLGFMLGLAGLFLLRALDSQSRQVLMLLTCSLLSLAYGLADTHLLRLPRPQLRRQVPRGWSERFSPTVSGLLYGGQLGLAVTTYIPIGGYYALLVAALLFGNALGSAALVGAFGAGRALPLLVLGPQPAASSIAVSDRLSTANGLQELTRLVTGLLLSAIGGFLFASGLAAVSAR